MVSWYFYDDNMKGVRCVVKKYLDRDDYRILERLFVKVQT